MAVSNDFTSSELDLNGQISISSPTALVWGPDGRLYVTEVDGDIKVLTVEFGDKDPSDGDPTANFYATDAEAIDLVKTIPNFNDNGTPNGSTQRQVTGIDVTQQFDANGDPVTIDGKPAVVMYVTSSDSRIGAGGGGNDAGLDTNSGMITKLVQTQNGWEATDLVRGLARSEENHATNGLEVIQEIDPSTGKLISERLIVANGGNANTGAPSNNFAGQQEQPYSAAILEVDLTELAGMQVKTDASSGRQYIYDLPTLDDPTRPGTTDSNDPFGGNDGLNSAKLIADGPVQIYSAGYRNAYDIEVTDDGRVWTYDNGANNNWGGRPAGEDEDGDTNSTEPESGTPAGYIATNLFVEDNSEIFGNFDPQNWDSLHEVTRSDDLNNRSLSAGQGGASLYNWDHPDHGELQLVYGGHPNPTRAEGARAGILYSPQNGVGNAKLMVSNEDKGGGTSDFLEVVAWLSSIGYNDTFINSTVVAVDPGVRYSADFASGFGGAGPTGRPTSAGIYSLVEDANGPIGLPADIDEIVHALNAIEGNYREAGYTDGSVDTGKGSVNGLTEYTSDIFDGNGVTMKGALLAASLGQGQYYIIGRDGDGVVQTTTTTNQAPSGSQRTIAEDRLFFASGGSPLGLASIGDDLVPHGGDQAFRGSVWGAIFKQNGPVIEILQPGNPTDNALLPVYAGQEPNDPTDNDLDGVDYINDPFDFDSDNGVALAAGGSIELNFSQVDLSAVPEFSGTIGDTGLMGAALDGVTPNRDAKTAADGFPAADQEPGLFDIAGNIIPGGNAPILQIKNVVEGSAIGGANTLRDGLHTGVRIDDDVQRIVAEVEIANWAVDQFSGEGRVTGLTFGDGTQSNFVRFVFGDVGAEGGPLGLEVGIETGDSYTVLATVNDQAFIDALTVGDQTALGAKRVTLQLEIADIGGDYDILARFKVDGQTGFTTVPLNAQLPAGVLRDVLDGTHQISDGDTTLNSGAAIGIVAEKGSADSFTSVDIDVIRVEAFGNEIAAGDAAAVQGATGTSGTDTVVYDGTDTDLGTLDGEIENFDGSASPADFTITTNDLSNVVTVGSGVNTVTTGAGNDVVRGSLDNLAGDTVTDFSRDDTVLVEDFSSADIQSVTYAQGSAIVTINGKSITLDGPDFTPENFDASNGAAYFDFTDTADGLEITSRAPLSPVVAIDAGGFGTTTGTLRDTQLTFQGDEGGGIDGTGFTTPGATKFYSNGVSTSFDYPDTDLDALLGTERSNGSPFGYDIAVPSGTYLVDLVFAEIFFGGNGFPGGGGDGSRVFDVDIEGVEAFPNIDIHAEAGGNGKQLVKTYEVEVTDGVLDIDFPTADTNQAKLSGLVVWNVGGSFTPVDATSPAVEEISLNNPQGFTDGTRTATVVITDETGFDPAAFDGLTGSVLQFSGYQPDDIADPTVTLSNGDKTATLEFAVTPQNATWVNGTTGTISLAAGAFNDAAGNGIAAASGGFVVQANLDSLDRGNVVRAINLGTTDADVGPLDPDPLESDAADNNSYGGAIASDSLITDAFGNPVSLEADSDTYHTSPKPSQNNNVDGQFTPTGSNAGGIDLDGSAYHTYRDSSAGTWTSTFDGFANGTYVVELHFAELFHGGASGTAGTGSRVGGFTVNGAVFDDEDAYAADGTKLDSSDDGNDTYDAFAAGARANGSAVGADTPTFIRKAVTVTDGTITVDVDATGQGQAGYSAIVVYDAVDSAAAPSLSIGDVTASEGEDATFTITRTGDLSEATSVEVDLTFDGTAEAADVGTLSSAQVTFAAGESSKTVTLAISDDDIEEAAETLTVTLSNPSGDAVLADASATLTIAASDSDIQAPVGATILELDFDGVSGEAIAVGGFDGTLGDEAETLDEATSEVTGGKLVVQTSEGDINDGADNGSDNDFTRSVDLSDPALNEIFLTSQFANPFTEALLTSQGVTNGVVPNYVQQGIVLGTGTQIAGEMVKLVWGGVAGTTGMQMWTKGSAGVGLSQASTLEAMIGTGASLFDVASVELSLVIDKTAGTIANYVTLFDATGSILGGTRPEATTGFATNAPVALPSAVLANLTSTTEPTHVGVTSSDNSAPEGSFGSFEATWDYLRLSSPQFVETGDDITAAITGPADTTEGSAAIYDITLSEAATEATSVTVDVTAGAVDPASLPQDAELSTDGTQVVLTFAAGESAKQVTIAVADDTLPELAETFDVSISGIGITSGAAGSVTTTIAANDGPVDSVNGTPTAGGDFSGDHLAPTDLGTLAEGATTIVSTQQGDNAAGGRERDYFTFSVEEGQELTGIIVKDYTGGETDSVSQGFMAIAAGDQVPLSQAEFEGQFPDGAPLLGGYIYNAADIQGASGSEGNVLDELGDGDEQGYNFPGFTAPLAAGTYTLWLNQGATNPSTVTLDLVTAPSSDVILSIADADPVEEADGAVLAFDLAATKNFSGDMDVSFTQGEDPSSQIVTFTDGTGTLTIPVTNDDVADGDDTISITLTGATSASDSIVISDTAGSADGTVTEDDTMDPIFERGDVVAAFNAGGPEIVQDGITFVAAENATNGAPFAGGQLYTDGNSGQPDQAVFDGTVYETEINSGGAGDGTPNFFTFSTGADIDPTKSYFVDLYFAEIFESQAGTRFFDVTVEDAAEPVLDDFNVVAASGDVNSPVVVQLADPISPGANGAIDLSFLASGERAKLSGIVIREAVEAAPTEASVSVADVTFSEEDATATITFTREGAASEDITIAYSTADGTATAGEDYTATTGSTIIAANGTGTASVTVPLTGDTLVEGDETFTVAIDSASAATNTVTVTGAPATITLTDDDVALPTSSVSVADVTASEEDGFADVTFTRDGDTASDMEITFSTADGTAIAGDDYTAPASQTVTILAGETTATARILVTDDAIDEGDETFTVTIESAVATGADVTIADTTATVTLGDDDAAEPVFVKGAQIFGVNAGTGGAVTTTDGVVFDAAVAAEWTFQNASSGSTTADYTGDGEDDADDTVYETEYWGGANGTNLQFQRGGIPAGDYILTIKLAEIFAGSQTGGPNDDGVGARVFDLTVNGTLVADDLDLTAEAGFETALDIDVPVTIADEGDGTGTLTVIGDPSTDNAKISALALFDAVEFDPNAVSVAVADVTVSEEAGTAEVVFTRDGNTASDMVITFSTTDGTALAGQDYTAAVSQTVTIPTGETTATAQIALTSDTDEEGDEDFTVNIESAVATGANVTVADVTATVTLTDDDAPDPADIDGDGIANTADPFAYDGDNGTGRVLADGGSFRQDFNSDTTDPFSAEAGFTGIIVNPALNPSDASAADPYGVSTTEAGVSVANGALSVTSSENDIFSTGTGTNNTVRDNYQSAADVSGVDAFTVEAKVANPFFNPTGDASVQAQIKFASFGVTLGAGGVDDYVKFVLGGSDQGPRVQLANESSLTGAKEENVTASSAAGGNIDTSLAKDVIFSVAVDTVANTVTGTATFIGGDDTEIGSIAIGPRDIDPAGSLAASIAGNNPLTDGTGGLAYGISITDWSNAPQFTAEWDYLELRGPEVANVAPTADPITPPATDERSEIVTVDLLADANAADSDGGTLAVDAGSVIAVDGDSNPVFVTLDGTDLSIDPAQFADLNAGESATVTVSYTITDGQGGETPNSVTLVVNGLDDVPVWYLDQDSDGFGVDDPATNVTSETQPADPAEGGQYVTQPGDADDADNTIYPEAPEINDGKDNDQDGETDEDNIAPVAEGDAASVTQNGTLTLTAAALIANDSDADGDTLSLTGVTNPVNGSVEIDGLTGEITFTPDADFSGDASFDYAIADGFGGTATATVSVTVSPEIVLSVAAPAAPVAETGDDGTTTPLDFVLSAETTEAVEANVTFTVNGGPEQSALVSIDATGSGILPVTIDNDDLADDDTDVEVALVSVDADGYAVSTVPAIGTVTEDDFVPVTTADSDSVSAGQTKIVDLTQNDTDADDDTADLVVTAISNISAGQVTPNGDGTVTVDATGVAAGTQITFDYTVSDPGGNTAEGSAAIGVDEVVVQPTTIRIQAESFDSASVFAIQNQNAADGQVIYLTGNAEGSAQFDLASRGIAPGVYTIRIGHFDENDGESTLGIDVSSTDAAGISESFVLDDDATSGNAAQSSSFRLKTYAGVEIGADGAMTLTGTRDAGEFGRIDYVEFTRTGDLDGGGTGDNGAPFAPFPPEAQEIDENAPYSLDVASFFFDAEEDAFTVALADGDVLPAGLTLDAAGTLSGAPTDPGDTTVSFVATDVNGNASAPLSISFSVTDVNEAPESQDIGDQPLTVGQNASFDAGASFTDPDEGDTLTFAVNNIVPGLTFDTATGIFTGTPSAAGSYQVTVTATDEGSLSASETFVFTVQGGGDDRDTIRIEAEDFTKIDGFFNESGGGVTRIRLQGNDTGEATYALGNVNASGSYDVRVAFFDESDGVSTASISAVNGDTETLLGSWVFDQDGGGNAAQAQNLRVLTFSGLDVLPGTELKLVGNSDTEEFVRIDYVELVPTANNGGNFAPSVTDAIEDLSIDGLEISIDLTGVFTDPEEDALTYSLIVSPEAPGLSIENGQLTGALPAGGTYEITITATDGPANSGVTVSDTFVITSTDTNEAPTLVSAPAEPVVVQEDGTLEEQIVFSDPDGVSYALAEGAPVWISIDENGFLTGTPENDDVGSVDVDVIATDGKGASSIETLSFIVENTNDAPVAGTLADQGAVVGEAFSLTLPAGTFTDVDAGDTLTYSATLGNGSALPAWLSIDPATGTLSGTPDSDADFSVIVTATDLAGARASAPAFALDVEPQEVNEDPITIEAEDFTNIQSPYVVNTITAASGNEVIRLPGNTTGTAATDLGAVPAGTYKLSVSFIDETDGVSSAIARIDGNVIGTWQFDGSAPKDAGPDAQTGVFADPGNFRTITFDDVFTVGAASSLELEVTSQGGEFGRIDKVTLTPSAQPNEAPSVTLENAIAELADDTDTTNPVKIADIAIADDGVGTNALGLAGEDAALFEITGTELFLKAGTDLSGVTDPLDVTVTVDDAAIPGTPDDSALLSVNITAGNTAPTLDGPAAVTVDENQTAVATFTATDPDTDDTLTFSVGGTDGALFGIDAGGVLTFNQAPDFEAPGDDGGDNVYDVTVSVSDGVNAPVTSDIAVTVSDVDPEGAVDTVVLRINAFGPEVAASDGGPNWLADTGAAPSAYVTFPAGQNRGDVPNGTNKTFTATNIPDGVPSEVLQNARSADGDINYTIPVADIGGPGDYRVNIFLAEIFNGNKSAGQRIFDVGVEGALQGDDTDPNAGGGGQVTTLSYEVNVDDGFLNVDLLKDMLNGVDNPIVNGIEVIKLAGGIADTEAPTASVALTQPADADSPLLVDVTLSDNGAIDATTLGDEDLELSIAGSTAIADITFTGFAGGVASYEIAAPSGGWQDGDDIAVTLKADEVADNAGNTNAQVSTSAVLDIGGSTGEDPVLLRINAFGPEVASIDGGPVWQGDGKGAANSPYLELVSTDPGEDRGDIQGYSGDAGAIPAGVPEAVIDTARSSDQPFSYNISVDDLAGNGNYTVNLYVAELFTGNQTAGQRSFDVAIEGQIQGDLNNVDAAAMGGADVSLISYNVAVTDGELNIDFLQDIADNPIINAIEIKSFSGDVTDPGGGGGDPDDAVAILTSLDDVDSDGSYSAGAVGSAELTVTPNGNVRISNFGSDSFKLENTGDKQIAAVFLDFRSAIYGDSVIDFDGKGGDTAARKFGVDSGAGGTGAFFDNDEADTYFLPGAIPLENNTGEGNSPVNGGWRGLLLKFDGTGFTNGEVVGFSGDMDPNSVAGLPKSGPANITNGIGNWDTGGVSGAELIGSSFSVLFDDGSTATGYLGSDGGLSGSKGEAVEGAAVQDVSVSVNGFNSQQAGTYGGAEPVIVVSGTPGQDVLVTMSKGLNPVTSNSVGAADLVQARLEAAFPEFAVNNAADFQSVEVTIGANGTATVPAGAFDYNNAESGEDFDGTNWTEALETAPIVVAASAVNGAGEPLGQVDRVYLESNGTPVEGGGGGGTGADGFFQGIGNPGGNYRYKVQIEDQNASGGQNPGGKWNFEDAPDGQNRQAGFQGDGYYLYGSNTNTGLNQVQSSEVLDYTINVPEGATGLYTFRFRVSRDGEAAGDQQNDLWLNFGKAGTNENIEEYLTNGEPEPTSNGFIKVFGGPNNGSWGNASNYDQGGGGPATQVQIDEPGLYTVSIAGRSQGFHVDFWELVKGNTPGTNAPDSQFVATGDTEPNVVDPIEDLSITAGTGATISTDGTFVDLDGDTLTLTANIPQAAQGFVSFANGTFTVSNAQIGEYTLTVTAEDDDGNTATDSFDLSVTAEPTGPELSFSVISGGNTVDSDLETGDSYDVSDFSGNVLFSGTFDEGSAASVKLTLQQNGGVVGTQVENITPYDITVAASGLGEGSYTLLAESYSATGASGTLLGSQSFGFSVTDGGGGGGGDVPDDISSTLILATSDFESRNGVNLTGSDDYEFQAPTDFVAMRFTGLGLTETPVASATITLTGKNNGVVPDLEVLIQNTANPAALTNSRSNVENRPYTDFGDDFLFQPGNVSNGEIFTIDVTDMVNAFLSQGGDQSTNSLVFQLDAQSGSNASAGFWAAANEGNSNASVAPKLDITYDDSLV